MISRDEIGFQPLHLVCVAVTNHLNIKCADKAQYKMEQNRTIQFASLNLSHKALRLDSNLLESK